VKVEVTYRGSFRRKYRITGVTSQPTRELLYVIVIFSVNFTYLSFEEMIFAFPPNRFPLDEKMNMQSIVDYFQEMYRYTIMRRHLPCIQVGSEKKTNYLPMEVCFCLN
jgi:eukaryotic translation initiation factor 2C